MKWVGLLWRTDSWDLNILKVETKKVGRSIAVVGMAGKVPGSANVSEFWKRLCSAEGSIRELSNAELIDAGIAEDDLSSDEYVKVVSALEGYDKFDAPFFKIAPVEAELMDPQIRLFLQCAWEALEDAGYAGEHPQNVGVFAGSGGMATNYYSHFVNRSSLFEKTLASPSHLGNDKDFLATYVSYKLNLTGPSFTIQTACSTSLVAVHQACLSLLNDECRMALAGGVRIAVPQITGYQFQEGHIFSRSGQVKAFDQGADGVVFGNGLGLVVLKKLEDAIEDNDHIYAVIKGSSISNDGQAKLSYAASSARGQIRCIRDALARADIDAGTIGFVEAHGTGTQMGDPEEVKALTVAFGECSDAKSYCALGAVKTNIGHLDAASGIIGLIKAVLSVYHGVIPPTLNYSKPNPRIKFDQTPFFVNDKIQQWSNVSTLRRAGVNSLGVGGTNAFVIIEEYSPDKKSESPNSGRPLIVPISARTRVSLKNYTKRLAAFLQETVESGNTVDACSLSYTLQVGRVPMKHRVTFVIETIDDLIECLSSYCADEHSEALCISAIGVSHETGEKDSEPADSDGDIMVQQLVKDGRWQCLAERWAEGLNVDWRQLYTDELPMRMSLPTYVFDLEKYWIDEKETLPVQAPMERILHPLVHSNTSDLSQQSYSTKFQGNEFFLVDHSDSRSGLKRKRLPTAAILEMVRASVELAMPGHYNSGIIELLDVDWPNWAMAPEEHQIKTVVFANEDHRIGYEVSARQTGHEIVYCHGYARLVSDQSPVSLDLDTIRSGLRKRRLGAEKLYSKFAKSGIEYGQNLQILRSVFMGSDELLAEITLSSSLQDGDGKFVLHPSILEAGLLAGMAFLEDVEGCSAQSLQPQSMKAMAIAAVGSRKMYARVRRSNVDDANSSTDEAQTLSESGIDIDFLDQEGVICWRVTGLTFSVSQDASDGMSSLAGHRVANRSWDGLSYITRWEEEKAIAPLHPVQHSRVLIVCCGATYDFESTVLDRYNASQNCETIVLRLGDHTKKISANEWSCGVSDSSGFETCLESMGKIDALYFLALDEQKCEVAGIDELLASQEATEIQLLRLIKVLKKGGKLEESVDSYILTLDNYTVDDSPNYHHGGGVTGIAYSLAQGNYQFLVRNIDLSAKDLCDSRRHKALLDMVVNEPSSNRGEVFRFESSCRYRNRFIKLSWADSDLNAIRHNGVYLILGGSGTVGQIFTGYLIERYNATIIWLGRSDEASGRIQEILKSYERYSKNIEYVQADVTDPDSLARAVRLVKSKYSVINGAFFSGQIIDFENSIDQTNEDDFRSILHVKSQGSWNFYNCLKDESPDFICYFSSGQAYSFSGAAKLAAYASAITFSETLVQSIQKIAAFPVGVINWGFWKATVRNMAKTSKVASGDSLDGLEDQEGFECAERFLSELQKGRLRQVMCMRVPSQMVSLLNFDDGQSITLSINPENCSLVELKDSIEIPDQSILDLKQSQEESELDDWLLRVLFARMNIMAECDALGPPDTVNELNDRCKVHSRHAAFWDQCLVLLSCADYFKIGEEGTIEDWKSIEHDNVLESWETRKNQYLRDQENKAMVSLVSDCLDNLTAIIQGEVLATDVIFPKSSMEKVEGVYKHNRLSDTFNEMVANSVVAFVENRLRADSKASLRILEIGAGTGGTSAIVFSKLKPFRDAIEEYCYTDLSKAFLFHAEDNYLPDNPYIRCELLDASRDIAEQGFEVGSYDLVLSTNCLHATRNIRQTLRNAKALLRENGFLVLNEISDVTIYTHLTFGLLDGWWLFEDPDLRIPGCPGLYPSTWQQVLQEEGFSVFFPATETHDLGQQIVVAQSDGVIYQEKAPRIDSVVDKAPEIAKNGGVSEGAAVPRDSDKVRAFVESRISDCLSRTLKIRSETVDRQVAFSDYGLDSILGVSFVDQVNSSLWISLNTAIIFDFSSLDRLGEHILKTRKSEVEACMDASSPPSEVAIATEGPSQDQLPVLNQSRRRFSSTELQPPFHCRGEIAVIGISGKFPKAESAVEFWKNLIDGVDGIQELPDHYLDKHTFFSSDRQAGKTRCKWGGVLRERDHFDPLFFNLSPREAESMNPHQRLILQESWKAIEDAGYNPRDLAGSQTGVFVGAEPTGYFGETFTGFSDAIIASRLPYVLNLNGPAFVINTGCSSSGVALHLACESLRSREVDLALSGGVNACMNQKIHISLSEIEMLSPSGRCATFDSTGDGTIISEAVGVVLLKRLDDAIVDRDAIYGTICASGINQDGASNGITAPSGTAQEQLIASTYRKFNIDPERIGYFEAHGTGTKLGDPVEANALVRAFRQFTDRSSYCAVGSAKSHIGHAAAAAGVIGLIKVLLSMKYKMIPQLLHFNSLNPLIEFDDSPFFINTELTDWKSPEGLPRMAALNSFGHSGTNAHLVIKEYLPSVASCNGDAPIDSISEVIIPLSARTDDQLREKAKVLLEFLQAENAVISKSFDLKAMAYTLQTGREAMDKRLGFIVSSVKQLTQNLEAYLDGNGDIDGFYKGEVRRENDDFRIFLQDEEMKEAIGKWIARRKLPRLLDLWVRGLELQWECFYDGQHPGRMNLPAYPFAKQRYWIDPESTARRESVVSHFDVLHPLLHSNASDLSQQCYTSTFSGNEFFLRDHQVNGEKMLPAVAYLEMARAAIEYAVPVQERQGVLELCNVVWVQPVVVARPRQVSITLLPDELDRVDYEIRTLADSEEPQDTVHCQGSAAYCRSPEPAKVDLEQLKTRMVRGRMESSVLYPIFAQMGIVFGPAHQGVLFIDEGEDESLAQIRIPDESSGTFGDYMLHPSVMDSALQACIGLLFDLNQNVNQQTLPFALDRLRIFSRCNEEMLAWVRYATGSSANDMLIKLDIDLIDLQGNVCIQMEGFCSRNPDSNLRIGTPRSAVGNEVGNFNTESKILDENFHEDLLNRVLEKEISVDEAVELFG